MRAYRTGGFAITHSHCLPKDQTDEIPPVEICRFASVFVAFCLFPSVPPLTPPAPSHPKPSPAHHLHTTPPSPSPNNQLFLHPPTSAGNRQPFGQRFPANVLLQLLAACGLAAYFSSTRWISAPTARSLCSIFSYPRSMWYTRSIF